MQKHEFKFKKSYYFLTFIGVITLTTLCVSAILPFAWPYKMIIMLVIGLYSWFILKYSQSIKSIKKYDKNKWYLYKQNQYLEGELRGDSTITHWFSILRFRVKGQRRIVSCVIFKDALRDEDYRHLLMVLKMK